MEGGGTSQKSPVLIRLRDENSLWHFFSVILPEPAENSCFDKYPLIST